MALMPANRSHNAAKLFSGSGMEKPITTLVSLPYDVFRHQGSGMI